MQRVVKQRVPRKESHPRIRRRRQGGYADLVATPAIVDVPASCSAGYIYLLSSTIHLGVGLRRGIVP